MKKKYYILTIIFIIFCIVLPFAIEHLYIIGKTHPVIHTMYTASDLLGYVATVVGLVISIIAFFLSLHSNELNLTIKHALTISDKNKEALVIQICNNSTFDCNINSVELCNKKERIFAHIISSPPFTVKAKGYVDFIVEVERIEKIIENICKNEKKDKTQYCIRLSLNKTIYLNTSELVEYLKRIKEHNKKLGLGVDQ